MSGKNLIAVPVPARPPNVRRLTGPLAPLFQANGKFLVPYIDREHVYVRFGRNQLARVEVKERRR